MATLNNYLTPSLAKSTASAMTKISQSPAHLAYNAGHTRLANTELNKGIKVGTMTQKSSGDSGSGSGSSGSVVSSDSNANALAAYMQAMQARAQAAYDNNVSTLNNAYSNRTASLNKNYTSTLDNLQNDYSLSKNNVNKDADSSYQDAYINYMKNQKNLSQNLSAQGITGGAAESTIAGLGNNYGNSRNTISNTVADNIADLENLYNTNKSSAYQAYNEQLASDELNKANALISLQNDLQNAIASSYDTSSLADLPSAYLSALTNAVSSQSGYTPAATAATNTVNNVSTGQSTGKSANFNTFLKNASSLKGNGTSESSIISTLSSQGANANEIASILQQIYG